MIWLQANWRYVGCVIFGIILGISSRYIEKTPENLHIETKQAQSGQIETASHITIKPREPLASLPGCPPCAQLPEITVDCGGKASGSQNQAVSATASASSPDSRLSLYIGLGSTQYGVFDASALLQYGKWGVMGQYDQKNVYGAKVLFKALEF